VNNGGGGLDIEGTSDNDEWTTLRTNVTGLTFGMALYSFDPAIMDTNVTVVRSHGAPETEAGWSRVAESYDTVAICTQLGATLATKSFDELRHLLPLAKGLMARPA